ncbi:MULTISPECIES: macrolide family glycosyltransferase [unclassified Streptomyces]|uniref:macrolide family glycosyltransferase n=1 Tax=unclassified Streptomyces TaxID=2593676 RepID=UPI0022B73B0C|nr:MULTISPECIES: macrolide family glycosyltransferase [unclassified Streptomyces]MCZ7413701.1 glycosyltransferase [Streptomyces sp. WMMC897]MCZ7430698.1 glycosyltransferase [Streptomyces sp. WMMC1477]
MVTSRPAHIAMINIPAPGHVHPSLEVLRELVARGHRVTYAVPGEYADVVRAVGAEPRPYVSTLPTEDDPAAWGTEPVDHLELFLDDAIQALPQIADAYAGDEPDLVLYDIGAYPAPVLARRWDVPAVQLSPCAVAWEGHEEDEAVRELRTALRTSPRGIAYDERFRGWLSEHGLPGTDPDVFVSRPRRSVVLIPRALQPHADRVNPAVYTFTGTCQGERGHQGDWHRPAEAERVVLVSLGSTFTNQPAFYRTCLAAFGDLPGWHVVLQIGKHVDEAELTRDAPLPANVEVHRWVPQLRILQQADLFVTHAGMGGSQEGLACGVPMIAAPQAVDQFANADALVALGVARRVEADTVTPEALRHAATALTTDPAVHDHLAVLRAEAAREGGAPQAADTVEAELPR